VCQGGGGTFPDPIRRSFFPEGNADFCIDPHADFRSFGQGEKEPLGLACESLPGDCARYARFELRHVVIVPYVIVGNSRARITVTLLEFPGVDQACAFFTDERFGDGSDDARSWQRVSPSEVYRSGTNALVWHANHVALLAYTDETSTPSAAEAGGAKLLELLSRSVIGKLPGAASSPLSVSFLSQEGPSLGWHYEHVDLFDMAGLGPGVLANYAVDGGTEPLAVLARTDDDAAKDVLRTFRRVPGSQSLKGAPYEAIRVPLRPAEGEKLVEWLFGRKRSVVLGVGREREKLERSAEELVRHAELLRLKAKLDALEVSAPDGGMR
jgi:hypothetical protein